MSTHHIEGVDYLLDRYACLDVPRDAPVDRIRAAIRSKRAANHPDRLRGAGPEILQTAAAVRDLADKCAAVLLNADTRAAYDDVLAQFERDRPASITSDATIPIDPTAASWDWDTLLDPNDPDTTEPDDLDAAIVAMSGYNPKHHALLEKMFAANPEDADARAMVREARVQAFTMASLIADFAWRKVGYHPGRTLDPHTTADPYAERERVADRIEDLIATGVPAAVEQRHQASVLRLAAPLKLLGHDAAGFSGADTSEPPNAATDQALSTAEHDARLLARITARAQDALRRRTDLIRHATADRAQALEAVLELTPVECLGNVAASTTTLDLALALNDLHSDRTAVAVVVRRHRDGSLRDSPLNVEVASFATANGFALSGGRPCLDAWRAYAAAGRLAGAGVVLIEHHPDVTPVLAELWWAARRPNVFVPTWTDDIDAVDEAAAHLADATSEQGHLTKARRSRS